MKNNVFTFGRFNPPTTGHKKIFDLIKSQNGIVFTSMTTGNEKNPLSVDDKVKYIKLLYDTDSIPSKTLIECLDKMKSMGHEEAIMLVGLDRYDSFKKLADDFNHHIDVSVRLPIPLKVQYIDRNDEMVSATLSRKYVIENDFDGFKKTVEGEDKDIISLYETLRGELNAKHKGNVKKC